MHKGEGQLEAPIRNDYKIDANIFWTPLQEDLSCVEKEF